MILIQIHQGTDFSNEKNMDVKNNSYHEPEPQILYEPDPEPPIKKIFLITKGFSEFLKHKRTKLERKKNLKKNNKEGCKKIKINDLGCVDDGTRATISAELRASWGWPDKG